MYQQEKRGFSTSFLIGLLIVALLAVGAYLATNWSASRVSQAERLPLGAAEKAYAERIRFLDLNMSRAANMLNQEITYLSGVLSNDGDRTINDLEITVEFYDTLNQVVLRETLRPLGPRPKPVLPLFRRGFTISFEHVPEDWNRQYPSLRVTGLVLE